MRLQIASLLLVVTTVVADGAAIIGAIQKVSASAAKLNNTVLGFHAGILGLGDTIKLLIDSTSLLNDIKAGTKTAQASAPLNFDDALAIAGVTVSLVTDVQVVISSIVNAKPTFDKLLIVSPTVLINLKIEKKASDEFSAAIISQLPIEFQDLAKTLVQPIDEGFDAAIAEYNPFK